MGKSAGPIAVVAASLLLVGCATPRAVLPGPTPAEVQSIVDQRNAYRWASLFPDEPLPDVQAVTQILPGDQQVLDACLAGAAGIPVASPVVLVNADLNRRMFVCSLEYPVDYPQPEQYGYYSPAQLDYLYDYFVTRSAPCLMLLGYPVTAPQLHDVFVRSYYAGADWNPYASTRPESTQEANLINLRCPPPSFL